MSIKSKVFAAAAALTLVGGVGASAALTAGAASAATPSCGNSCPDVFSHQFGTHHSPNFVVDVLRQGEKVGQPIILFRTSNYDPAEDFTGSFSGTVADFYAASMVSAAVALHYGCTVGPFINCDPPATDDPAFELEYAPYGVDSGLCMGVATTARQGTPVVLEPCGISSKTVWIIDTADSVHHYPRLRAADQRVGHQLLAPVRAQLPAERLPDRHAPAAAHDHQPDRFLERCSARSWAASSAASSGAPTSASCTRTRWSLNRSDAVAPAPGGPAPLPSGHVPPASGVRRLTLTNPLRCDEVRRGSGQSPSVGRGLSALRPARP